MACVERLLLLRAPALGNTSPAGSPRAVPGTLRARKGFGARVRRGWRAQQLAMAPAPVQWSEGFVHANGIDIHYLRSASPEQPVSLTTALPILVFLHGLANGGAVQIPFLSLLTDEFDVVIPDARGCCKSKPVPKGSFTFPNLVADAAAVIRHVSPDRPVFLVGHSAGASTAANLTKERPDLVRALVLEDPPWFRTPKEPLNPDERSVKDLPPFIRSLKAMSDEEFAKYDVRGADLTPPAISLFASFRQFDLDNCEETFQETDDLINVAVEGIATPVLLIRGQPETGSRTKPSVLEQILPGWPHGKDVVYEGAGHVPHLMRDRYIQDLRSFFKSNAVETE